MLVGNSVAVEPFNPKRGHKSLNRRDKLETRIISIEEMKDVIN
jgi:hypothetical protein